MLHTIKPRWTDELVIVAAPGPSLTEDVAERCRGHCVVAVQDAYRRIPWADILYGCDAKWWHAHDGACGFAGEKWSSHDNGTNDKTEVAAKYGVRLVAGKGGDAFSTDPSVIHYLSNSGAQAVGLAIHFGAAPIVLVGFDMQGSHFFGPHPAPLTNADPRRFVPAFERAAKRMPKGVTILNATPGSALRCFPMVSLNDALSDPPRRRPAAGIAAPCEPRPDQVALLG